MVKELILEADAEEEESNNITSKLKDNCKLVDKMARVSIKKTQLVASEMKCYCGYNNYVERDNIIISGESINECPRCSETEAWEHVVQCRIAVSIVAEFIL